MNQSPALSSRSNMGALRREIPLIMIVLTVFSSQLAESAIQELLIPPNTGCACPGNILSYTCTAVGAGNTLWEGSAFSCAGNSIVLRHSQFGSGDSGDCNGGDIRARSTEVTGDCYTSQLSVRVSITLNGKLVNCSHLSTMGINTIGSSTLTVFEAPYPPPDNVRLTDVREGSLSFSWDSLGPNCDSAIYYVMSDCGGCPDNTSSTTVNCIDLQLSTIARECTFRIHAELCGSTGNQSSPLTVMLKLPDVPHVRFIPRFSDDDKQLIALVAAVDQSVSYSIADGISGSVTTYVMKISSNSEALLSSPFTPMPCVDISCGEFVRVPFKCFSTTTVSVTLSAANRLGVGPATDPLNIDCTNNFVDVNYDSATSSITCTFLDQLEGIRSCQLQYGDCPSQLTRVSQGNTTSNTVVHNLQFSGPGREHCYLVTASNGSYTVMVEGRFNTALDSGFPVAAIVVIVLIIGAVVVVLVVVLLVVISKLNKWRGYRMRVPKEYLGHTPLNQFNVTNITAIAQNVKDAEDLTVESHFNLKRIDLNDIVFFKLKSSYPKELNTIVEEFLKPKKFKRGCAFYEFLFEEDISDVQEIIFMNEDGEYFYPDVDKRVLREGGMIGENLIPQHFEAYRVFVQSTGLGKRFIPKNGMVLYKEFFQMHKHPLIRVDASKFALRRVFGDCTLKTFCGMCVPKANISAVYIELNSVEDVDDILDVILLDKEADRIFTGTFALHMAKEHYNHCKPIDEKHWRVYVLKEFGEEFQLRKDMYILYQIQETSQTSQSELLEPEQRLRIANDGGDTAVQMQKEPENSCQNVKPPLIPIDSTPFVVEKIATDCTLDKFREQHGLDGDVHNVFVESRSSLENAKVLDIILEDKECENMLYTRCVQWNNIKDCVEDEHRWRAYALKDYGGLFKLSMNTWVMYRARSKQMSLSDATLMPIYSNHFKKIILENGCTVEQLIQFIKPQKCNVFLELDYVEKHKNIKDVILMEKATGKLYSGPYACEMVKKHLCGSQDLDQDRWESYVYCKFKSSLQLFRNSKLFYQNPDFTTQEFQILMVDEDNVRMSEYIKQQFGVYVKGAAFYEFTESEDLLSYKEVVHLPEDALKQDGAIIKLESSTKLFYGIPGAPGLGLKPPDIIGKRIFIQCTSQGSRCLKMGMVILCKVNKTVTVDDHKNPI